MVRNVPTIENTQPEALSSLPVDLEDASDAMMYHIEVLKIPNDSELCSDEYWMPLHLVRPLTYWRDAVGPLAEAKWDPTIHYALKVTATYSMLSEFYCKGSRDDTESERQTKATMFCHAMFVGAELIITGDCVKLLTSGYSSTTDALIVSGLKIVWVQPCTENAAESATTCVHVSGHALTLNPGHASTLR